MNIYLQTFAETAQIVLPIFFILACGFILRRQQIIDDHFVDQGSRLVFTLALPLLIFLKVATADLQELLSPLQLVYIAAGTLTTGVIGYGIAIRWIKAPEDQGVFTQGCFRSNFAIVGLAIIYSMFGDPGLAIGSLILALVIPLYNIMSIICLSLPLQGKMSLQQMSRSMITNPLVMAVLLALPISFFDWQLPAILTKTGDYFSDMTLPLALLAIGASLNPQHLRNSSTLALHTSLIKTLWSPIILTLGAWLVGFTGSEMTILFILFGCPAAASGFVMAKAMGGNGTLAANIVVLSTLLSIVTLTTGIYTLKLLYP